ncbi:hypothetical protein E2P81_ATG01959 [Venturia nashicola]|nr:hypothetical protein E2P81_ATG01959 [Venturia nashicola]
MDFVAPRRALKGRSSMPPDGNSKPCTGDTANCTLLPTRTSTPLALFHTTSPSNTPSLSPSRESQQSPFSSFTFQAMAAINRIR